MKHPECKKCKRSRGEGEWAYPVDGSMAHRRWSEGEVRTVKMHLHIHRFRTPCGLRYEGEVDSSG